jgi:6,7-dimethyl-8-ribityllumazine synthase
MSGKKKTNLSELREIALKDIDKVKIGLVVAEWNPEVTGSLEKGAIDTLKHYGITGQNIKSIKVPGSFELPMGARIMLKYEKYDAIICLGCVIKGETSHNEYINHAVSTGITHLGLTSGIPCIFGVLTPLNMEQALDRAGGKHGNKGVEAAVAALEMVRLEQQVEKRSKSIGFGG